MSKLKRVYRRIDDDLEKHIIKLQEFIGQPSISQTGEGVRECAERLRSYLTELGCPPRTGLRLGWRREEHGSLAL